MKRLQFPESIKKEMRSERGTLGWKRANPLRWELHGKPVASWAAEENTAHRGAHTTECISSLIGGWKSQVRVSAGSVWGENSIAF